MEVAFWLTSTTRELNEDNWGISPLGGAEVSAVNLGEALDCDVTYYLQRCQPFDKEGLHVRRHDQILDNKHKYFICVRPHPVLSNVEADKRLLWSGDAFDQPSNRIFGDEALVRKIDAFVFKSEWQRRTVLETQFFIPKEKAFVIYNGVKAEYFKNLGEEPENNRFIHASTWYRGVHNFISLWPKIKEKIPRAKLVVYSKTTLYSDINEQHGQEVFSRIKQLPDVELREPIHQKDLVKELRKSWLMLYPNTHFLESSCGVALQSLAAGTPVVTTKRGGLVETVGENGILIDSSSTWKDDFVEGVFKLWYQHTLRNQLSHSGRQVVKNQSWKTQAEVWKTFLKSL